MAEIRSGSTSSLFDKNALDRMGRALGGRRGSAQQAIDDAYDRVMLGVPESDRVSRQEFEQALNSTLDIVARDPGQLMGLFTENVGAAQTAAPTGQMYEGIGNTGTRTGGWQTLNGNLEFNKIIAEMAIARGLVPQSILPQVQEQINFIDQAIENINSMSSLGLEEAVSTYDPTDLSVGANSLFADPSIMDYRPNPAAGTPLDNSIKAGIPGIDYLINAAPFAASPRMAEVDPFGLPGPLTSIGPNTGYENLVASLGAPAPAPGNFPSAPPSLSDIARNPYDVKRDTGWATAPARGAPMPDIRQAAGGLLTPSPNTLAPDLTRAGTVTGPAGDFGKFGVNVAGFDNSRFGSEPAFDTSRFDSTPAFDAGRFATYQPAAPNSPEKARENAIRDAYFSSLASKPAPASLGISQARFPDMASAAARSAAASNYADNRGILDRLDQELAALESGSVQVPTRSPASPASTASVRMSGATTPASTYAPARTTAMTPTQADTLATQYAAYGMMNPNHSLNPAEARVVTNAARVGMPAVGTSATTTQSPVVGPRQTAAPITQQRSVPERTVKAYEPPAPAMTPERAKALGMVPTPGVPGAYMPNVPGNQAQVMRDQAALIAANPLEAIGRMVVGALQGGVFHSGNLVGNIVSAPGGIFGQQAQTTAAPQGTRDAYGGVGGGLGGLGGGFQAGGGNWGNYGSSGGFNSGFTSSSGFTYDR